MADADDDWVKQALAEAMLADSAPEPDVSPGPDMSPEQEPSTAETESAEAEPDLALTEPIAVVVDSAATDDDAPDDSVAAVDTPGPAVTSRLFERPSFDATTDPGVDSMIASAQARPTELADAESPDRSGLRSVIEWLVVLGSAVVVALLLRAFLFQAFYIPSESMEATLRVNDRVLVNKLSYDLHDVHRGDVVVFRRPEDDPGAFRDLIKRVIGLPGETIAARDNTIYINGQVLIEPYLTPGEVIGDFGPVEIPDGEMFVMGDNRDNSGDSRVSGTVDTDRIIGRAFFLFWPFDRAGSL